MLRRLNFFIIGLLGASVISAITVPFLAWFYSPDSLGRFSFFLLTVTFATQVGTLGLEQGYVREYHSSLDKGELLLQALVPSFVVIFFACVVLSGFSFFDEVASLVISVPDVLLGGVIVLGYILSIGHRFVTVSYRVRSRGKYFCFVLLAVKLVFLALAYGSYLLGLEESNSLYWSYVLSMFIPLLGLGVFSAYKNFSVKNFNFLKVRVRGLVNLQLVAYSFPLLVGALAFWGVKFSGHIGLRVNGSFEELAYYSVGVSIAAGMGLFSSIFNTMWFPFLFKAEANGCFKEAYSAGLELTVGLLLLGVGATSVLAEFIVRFLPETFHHVRLFLPLLVLSSLLYTLSEVTGSGIVLSRKTHFALYSGLLGSGDGADCRFAVDRTIWCVGRCVRLCLRAFSFLY